MSSVGVTGAVQRDQQLRQLARGGRLLHGQRHVRADRGRRGQRDAVGGQQRTGQPADGGAVRHRHVSANTNLALNQPVTASGSTQTYVPSNAVDGNTSSYWESTDNAFPQWFQVDLGSSVSVGRIVLDLPPSTAWGTRTQTITVQGSTDGTNYTTLAASAGYTFNPVHR